MHTNKALFNKKKLSEKHKNYSFNTNNNPFFISENLTRMNKSLAYQGNLNVTILWIQETALLLLKLSDHSKAIKVYHMNDLLDLFPGFNFDDEPFHDTSPDASAHSVYWVGFGCC